MREQDIENILLDELVEKKDDMPMEELEQNTDYVKTILKDLKKKFKRCNFINKISFGLTWSFLAGMLLTDNHIADAVFTGAWALSLVTEIVSDIKKSRTKKDVEFVQEVSDSLEEIYNHQKAGEEIFPELY